MGDCNEYAFGGPFYNPWMATSFDVCIRGAGIVGRTLALQLAAKRLRVALTKPQQTAPGHSDVRAYALSQPSKICWNRYAAGPTRTTPRQSCPCRCMATTAAR